MRIYEHVFNPFVVAAASDRMKLTPWIAAAREKKWKECVKWRIENKPCWRFNYKSKKVLVYAVWSSTSKESNSSSSLCYYFLSDSLRFLNIIKRRDLVGCQLTNFVKGIPSLSDSWTTVFRTRSQLLIRSTHRDWHRMFPAMNMRQNFENAQWLPRRHLLNMIFDTASLRLTMFCETPIRRTDGTTAAAIPHYQRNTLQTYLEIMAEIFVTTFLEVVLI